MTIIPTPYNALKALVIYGSPSPDTSCPPPDITVLNDYDVVILTGNTDSVLQLQSIHICARHVFVQYHLQIKVDRLQISSINFFCREENIEAGSQSITGEIYRLDDKNLIDIYRIFNKGSHPFEILHTIYGIDPNRIRLIVEREFLLTNYSLELQDLFFFKAYMPNMSRKQLSTFSRSEQEQRKAYFR